MGMIEDENDIGGLGETRSTGPSSRDHPQGLLFPSLFFFFALFQFHSPVTLEPKWNGMENRRVEEGSFLLKWRRREQGGGPMGGRPNGQL